MSESSTLAIIICAAIVSMVVGSAIVSALAERGKRNHEFRMARHNAFVKTLGQTNDDADVDELATQAQNIAAGQSTDVYAAPDMRGIRGLGHAIMRDTPAFNGPLIGGNPVERARQTHEDSDRPVERMDYRKPRPIRDDPQA